MISTRQWGKDNLEKLSDFLKDFDFNDIERYVNELEDELEETNDRIKELESELGEANDKIEELEAQQT